jgi:hypothetical protein
MQWARVIPRGEEKKQIPPKCRELPHQVPGGLPHLQPRVIDGGWSSGDNIFVSLRSPEGTSQWPMTERRVTSPAGGFTASPSLEDAYNSSRVGRHCGTLHEYNGEAPEERSFDLSDILGRRLYYINTSLDESSYTSRVLTVIACGNKIALSAILVRFFANRCYL